jgi:hypothetical protein
VWPDQTAFYVWTNEGPRAVFLVAKSKGVSVVVVEKSLSPEHVAEIVKAMTPEDREALAKLAGLDGKKKAK